jgi:hypothetical protein
MVGACRTDLDAILSILGYVGFLSNLLWLWFFDGGLLAAVTAPPRRLMNLPKPRRHYFQFLALLGFCLLVSLLVSGPSFSSRLSNLRPCSTDDMVSR